MRDASLLVSAIYSHADVSVWSSFLVRDGDPQPGGDNDMLRAFFFTPLVITPVLSPWPLLVVKGGAEGGR